MTGPDISVLCPTRKRPALLKRSFDSLMEKSSGLYQVEFLAACDPDDAEFPRGIFDPCPQARVLVANERYGYGRLHEYYNRLARIASGKWLFLWNDDAFMRTQDWDRVIMDRPDHQVLWPEVNHHWTGNLFPVWPRAWSEAMGHVSLSPNVDRWISEVGRQQGLEFRIPVIIYHERADITGLNDDKTYREGRFVMGNADDSQFHSAENREARARDIVTVDDLVYGAPR